MAQQVGRLCRWRTRSCRSQHDGNASARVLGLCGRGAGTSTDEALSSDRGQALFPKRRTEESDCENYPDETAPGIGFAVDDIGRTGDIGADRFGRSEFL